MLARYRRYRRYRSYGHTRFTSVTLCVPLELLLFAAVAVGAFIGLTV